jgi:hypothetical protein
VSITNNYFVITFTKYYSGDQIKTNERVMACSVCGEEKEVYTGFWWRDLREGEHLEDPSVDGRIILK